jgi:hypothetical protein
MALALLPLAMLLVLTLSWGYFYWQPTQDWVSEFLSSWQVMQSMMDWMQSHGAGDLQGVLVPLVVIFSVTPILVVMSLLAVSLMMGPALVSLVVQRRFAHLAMKHGGSVVNSIVWTLVSTFAAMAAMVISLPLWVVPPLMFIVPPIIWGWLSYRVMVFDALVAHASRDERIAIGQKHRLPLLLIHNWLPRRLTQYGVGIGRFIRCSFCGASACSDLDLFICICFYGTLVHPLQFGRIRDHACAGQPSRSWCIRPRSCASISR